MGVTFVVSDFEGMDAVAEILGGQFKGAFAPDHAEFLCAGGIVDVDVGDCSFREFETNHFPGIGGIGEDAHTFELAYGNQAVCTAFERIEGIYPVVVGVDVVLLADPHQHR